MEVMNMNKLLKAIATALALIQIAMTVMILTGSPTIITHWGLTGKPDATGSKYTSILLCVMNTLIYTLFWAIDRHPQWCNYPKEFVNRERANIYLLKMSWTVAIWLALAPAVYLTYAMYSGSNLNHWIIPLLFLCGIIGIVNCAKKLNRIE